MHAYVEIDGLPVAADGDLLTGLLRDRWGFDGVVVADYFGVAFLHILHGVAADLGEAAALALLAGIDVELPTGDAYVEPLKAAIESGAIDIALVDRSVLRVLDQKEELGLLDEKFEGPSPTGIDLDSPAHRALAKRLAEESVILLANDGTLPIAAGAGAKPTIAAIGPNADRFAAMFGCYSFANHVLVHRPGVELGLDVPTLAEALSSEFPGRVTVARGCDVDSDDDTGFAEAVAAAAAADIAILAMGDHAGLFGQGTVGEGCDRDDLELPGLQRRLIEEVLATGTPVVLVLLTGRPYAVGWALERCAAAVQAFFPGEEGAGAIARVLSGSVNPSGHLPVTMPRSAGAQPYSYLRPALGGDSDVTNLSSVPALPFGHGLSYTSFEYSGFAAGATTPTEGAITAAVTVKNTGDRQGATVVQLYGRVLHAPVTRPVAQLIGYRRVELEPGATARIEFQVPTTRLAFSDREYRRVVHPGQVELWVGNAETRAATGSTTLSGPVHEIGELSPRWTEAKVS
jgi:beta-glucosidase